MFRYIALFIALALCLGCQKTPEQVDADQKAQADLDQKAFALYSQLPCGSVVIPHSDPDSTTNYDYIWVIYKNDPSTNSMCVKMYPDHRVQCMNYYEAYSYFHALKVIEFVPSEWAEIVRPRLY